MSIIVLYVILFVCTKKIKISIDIKIYWFLHFCNYIKLDSFLPKLKLIIDIKIVYVTAVFMLKQEVDYCRLLLR